MKHEIAEQLSGLDPEREFERIMYLLQCYEFPWDYERALEFALFQTYASPRFPGCLMEPGNSRIVPGNVTMIPN